MQPMTGLVEKEAPGLIGPRMSAQPLFSLEEQPGALEVIGSRDAGQAASEDHHPRVRVRRRDHLVGASITRPQRWGKTDTVGAAAPRRDRPKSATHAGLRNGPPVAIRS